jgi:hypothetical protein
MNPRLQRLLQQGGGMPGMGGALPQGDQNVADTAETTHISSLALLKMLKHGRAGVPMEVMGLMLGDFVDDYTVQVVDVFAMPQSGTGVSVEAVDPVFQTKMLDMLKQTNRYGQPSARTCPTATTCVVLTSLRCCWAGVMHALAYALAYALALALAQASDGGRVVPQPSGIWLLAVVCRYQHAAELRAAEQARGGCGGGPHSVR